MAAYNVIIFYELEATQKVLVLL